MTIKYLDLDGDPALLDEREDGRAYAWVKYEDDEWQKINVADVVFEARVLDEEKFKERFSNAGQPEGLSK